MFPRMLAKDLMMSPVVTIRSDATVADLCELMQFHHVNGVPVLDGDDRIVGIASEEDILYGALGLDASSPDAREDAAPRGALDRLRVSEIMTSPAITVGEDTDVAEACRTMWKMRIHRLPVVQDGKVVGILSAMDLVRAVAEGEIAP